MTDSNRYETVHLSRELGTLPAARTLAGLYTRADPDRRKCPVYLAVDKAIVAAIQVFKDREQEARVAGEEA